MADEADDHSRGVPLGAWQGAFDILRQHEAVMAANYDPTDSQPIQTHEPVKRQIGVFQRAMRVYTYRNSQLMRYFAVSELGRLGDPGAVPPLVDRLTDADPVMRRYVAGALGLIGDARAVGPLVSVLDDDDPRIRRRAAIALGQIGDVAALASLLPLLHDSDDAVRLRATESLGALRDPRAARPLGLVFGRPHERWFVRRAAAKALGWLGRDGRAELIARAERDASVRAWADWVLRRLPPDDGVATRPGYHVLGWYDPPSRPLGAERRGNYVTDFLRDAPSE